jgi:hypothetical protein
VPFAVDTKKTPAVASQSFGVAKSMDRIPSEQTVTARRMSRAGIDVRHNDRHLTALIEELAASAEQPLTSVRTYLTAEQQAQPPKGNEGTADAYSRAALRAILLLLGIARIY